MHPRARRPLLIATAVAAVLYLPWLPSLKGDVDSPTTDILSAFSPLSLDGSAADPRPLGRRVPLCRPEPSHAATCPGSRPALLMLAASLSLGAYGLYTMRSRLEGVVRPETTGASSSSSCWPLATPVGTLLQSAVGTNVFSTRSLAASWPYLALAVAALITVGRPVLRIVAAALGGRRRSRRWRRS